MEQDSTKSGQTPEEVGGEGTPGNFPKIIEEVSEADRSANKKTPEFWVFPGGFPGFKSVIGRYESRLASSFSDNVEPQMLPGSFIGMLLKSTDLLETNHSPTIKYEPIIVT